MTPAQCAIAVVRAVAVTTPVHAARPAEYDGTSSLITVHTVNGPASGAPGGSVWPVTITLRVHGPTTDETETLAMHLWQALESADSGGLFALTPSIPPNPAPDPDAGHFIRWQLTLTGTYML